MAQDRLGAARAALDAGFPSNAASAAYYAMLYAGRAALSEENENSKTHSGTWTLSRRAFVEPGRFDGALFTEAHRTQQVREAADYDAFVVPTDEAAQIVSVAERFVAAVGDMLKR
jgi:uncharacterized protein (UPF0332 family)